NVILPMLEAGHDVVLVNPRRDEAYGRPVVVDLASAGRPIDAVLSIVNAEASLTVVEEAAALGCGGVVVVASGFAETGPDGVEALRRPADFFASVSVARDAGKPVIALKLGRSARARTIMQSHTGAIADEGWIYDLAFREHGVLDATDIDDLLDRAQLFAQLPPDRHRPIRSIGVIAASG